MNFKNLNLINPIIRAVTEAGFSKPTPFQALAIPHILSGKDIVGFAPDNSGKTAAYIMPVLQLMKKNAPDHGDIRTLILASTKHGALATEQDLNTYSKYLPLSLLSVFSGVMQTGQLSALKKRVDVLIATPERLQELAGQGRLDLSKIEILVLDDAQTFITAGLLKNVKEIMKTLPVKKQTLVFASEMPAQLNLFVEMFLINPIRVTENSEEKVSLQA